MDTKSEARFTLPSFAKINLSLRILGRRDDGFHELCTIFQTVSLKDELSFSESGEITLTCSDKNIPLGKQNLIVQAAEKLRDRYQIKTGARIHLEKNIPAPGGLGGGSSNAAVALIGLTRLWKIKTNLPELEEIGRSLGADVPFFLHGGTALGTERGDKITPLNTLSEKNILVATPDKSISTAAAFARLNAPRLTNKTSKSILQICRSSAETTRFGQTILTNDFEPTIFALEPEIERVKKTLLGFRGVKQTLLSGSGASVFAVFDETERLETALNRLKKESSWRVFSVETISRAEYRASLNLNAEQSN